MMPPRTGHWIPSMYRRRLLLLASVALFFLLVLVAQLSYLTLVQGEHWMDRAQGSMLQRRLIQTERGLILDRHQRILALDEGSFDLAVAYPVISGQWAYQCATREAFQNHRSQWRQLEPAARDALIAQYQQAYDQQVQSLWSTLSMIGRVDAHELEERKINTVRRVQIIANDVAMRQYERRLAQREQRRSVVWQHLEQLSNHVWLQKLEQWVSDLDDPPTLAEVVRPISEQESYHPMLSDLDDASKVTLERLIEQAKPTTTPAVKPVTPSVWSQVQIQRSRRRSYPLETLRLELDRSHFPGPLHNVKPLEIQVQGVGTQIIGSLRPIWREDAHVQQRPFRRPQNDEESTVDLGGYLPGDLTGSMGIEKSMEEALRGQRGQILGHLDTQQQQRQEPLPGQTVRLSIDIQLQARIQALMSQQENVGLMIAQSWHRRRDGQEPATETALGQPLNGAALVIEVATGQVLAAVSVPGISLADLSDHSRPGWSDSVNRPYVFRPIAQPYEPGSTIKPLVLCAAITDGRVRPQETIECHGFLDPRTPNAMRCWIYKQPPHLTHGPLRGDEALARSCNIYYYTLGRRLGMSRLVWWMDRFGLGKPQLGRGLSAQLSNEAIGDLPDPTNVVQFTGVTGETNATFMGIGQGPVRWTLLQAATAYTALARGGLAIQPTFVAQIGDEVIQPQPWDMGLDPRGVAMAMRGLEDAVNQSYGTGHHLSQLNREPVFNVQGVKVMGKSGTADAAPLRIDSNEDGRITSRDTIVRSGDHSWFVGMVQRPGSTQPDFVIAVVVEYAGSGGAVAGPIANQIIHALRAQGYL